MSSEVVQVIKVGIADINVACPPSILRTSGLGSCVGIILYDRMLSIAGMAHIMLPSANVEKKSTENLAKYADTAIDELVRRLINKGVSSYRLKAKIAGGAQMFQFNTASDTMRIGSRNIKAVKEKLQNLKIPIEAEDVGGKNGRTIEFDPATSVLRIRTVHKGEKMI
ncbi:chemotaxis protein CheD [Halobacillus seohaensis]|uniref:Probable chemoreceptor glutamine deamidase CheD n=1 Tax=Halobacillus seohaensis TaxID=447421 RepID=A0ABW2EKW2_9BACI